MASPFAPLRSWFNVPQFHLMLWYLICGFQNNQRNTMSESSSKRRRLEDPWLCDTCMDRNRQTAVDVGIPYVECHSTSNAAVKRAHHMHSRGGSFLGAILCFFCAVGRDRPRGQRTIVISYTNENKKESVGNQLPPTHFLEEVVVIQTGPPVDCTWGPVFHGMQIINHHHSDPQECLMTQ